MSITPESVRELLGSEDLGERLKSVNLFRQLDPVVAFELAQIAAADQNARVRYAAVSQLASLGNQNLQLAYDLLTDRLLNDPEPDVQAAAADSLGGLHLEDAFDHLAEVYQTSGEWLVRFSIVAALGELGSVRAFDLLKDALNSQEDLLKMAAISSLGELGDSRAIPLLVEFVNNPDWQIRHRLAQALCRLGGNEAREVLKTLAKDNVEQVATEANIGLSAS
ncbi:MAG TPA: HEAT repeat domain-containing protein [Halomicronema sp.]